MSGQPNHLDEKHLAQIAKALHEGAAQASESLAKWIGKKSLVEVDSLEQLPLEEASELLAGGDDVVCFCTVEVRGALTGEMILAFDDASGFMLSDMLLEREAATAHVWDELAISAAMETTNIVCCSYLNALTSRLPGAGSQCELLPSPPRFSRDFAASLLQFALMGQAIASNQVIVAKTRFEVDGAPVDWTLLFVPDAESMQRLPALLSVDAESGDA